MPADYITELDLNINSLIYVINQCRNKPMFTAGVYITHPTDREECVKWIHLILYELQRSNDEVWRMYRSYNNTCQVKFTNGSRLDVVIPNDGARGYRFCSVVMDDYVGEDIKRHIILPKIIPYERCIPLDREDSRVGYRGLQQ